MEITFNKKAQQTEIYYKGGIMFEDNFHPFWIKKVIDFNEMEFSVTLEWFFRSVPLAVRKMEETIILQFKKMEI